MSPLMTHNPISFIQKKYDWNSVIIWLILAFLAAGSAVGNMQPSRLLAIAAFAYLLVQGKLIEPMSMPSKILIFTMFFWITWGIISLSWTSDLVNGINELIIIAIGFIIILTLLNLANNTSNILLTIRSGWISAFIITLPLALWELFTFQHIPDAGGLLPGKTDLVETGGPASTIMMYAGATFGNRNNYCAFIVLCFPLLLWAFEQAKKKSMKIKYVILMVLGVFIVVVDGSRLGMFCLVLELLFWLFLQRRGSSLSFKKWSIVLLIALIFYLAFEFQEHTLSRLEDLQEGLSGSSQVGRTNLYINGLRLIKSTAGLGVGAGGFMNSVRIGSNMRTTDRIYASHNLWIEILADYGIIVWSLFIFWLIATFCYIVKVRNIAKKIGHDGMESALRYTIILMVSFPFCFLMNSSIFRWTILWSMFGCLAVITEVAWKLQRMNQQQTI
jgi:O-antigen ligase